MSLQNSIVNVEQWLAEKRSRLDIILVKDIEHLIRVAKEKECGAAERTDVEQECSCHERDGSYRCEFCRSQGMRGHMERTT